MANYPPYQYQPQMGQFGPQMQNPYVFPTYQPVQPQAANTAQEQPLFCRVVTSKEEALAVPVDFSGRPMTLLDTAHGRVWIKVFNPATGSAELDEYCKASPAPPVEKPAENPVAYVALADFQRLEARVATMGDEIMKLRPVKRRTQHEEVVDDEV